MKPDSVNALALAAVQELLHPGVTTADLNAAAEEILRKHAAYSPFKNYGQPPFPGSICTSVNEELVHGIPGKRELKEGDIISIDCGAVVNGFVGDAAFTAGIGKISPTAGKLIEVTRQALFVGISMMRPGNKTGRCLCGHTAICRSAGIPGGPGIYRPWRRPEDARRSASSQLRNSGLRDHVKNRDDHCT